MNDDELERRIGSERSKEVIEDPLQRVRTVLAVVDSNNHGLLLRRCCHRGMCLGSCVLELQRVGLIFL